MLVNKLRTYNGVYDAQTNYKYGEKMFAVKLMPSAYQYQLSLKDVAEQIGSGFSGNEIIKIQRGKDEVPINLSFRSDHGQNSVKYFRNMRIRTPDGKKVPLMDIAELTLQSSPQSLNRHNGKLCITVVAKVDMTIANPGEITSNLNKEFLPRIRDSYGISFSQEGTARETQDVFDKFKICLPLVLLGIYFILVLMFKSYLQPFAVMAAIPFGAVAGILGSIILNLPISLFTILGLAALTGIVVNDAIVLLSEINHQLKKGEEFFQAIQWAGKRRFRAILLTSLTTFVGLIPLSFSTNIYLQFFVPIAATIAFGVLFSTFVNLLLTPCFFAVLNDLRRIAYFIWNIKMPTREEVEPNLTVKKLH